MVQIIGLESGVCKNCKQEVNTIYKGYCYICRVEYGEQKRKELQQNAFMDIANKLLEYGQCIAMTKKRKRCKCPCIPGELFCGNHLAKCKT